MHGGPSPGPDGADDGLDIKHMVRTYVFLNDPRVRQVTTKFLVLALTLGGLFALYAWSVSAPTLENADAAPTSAAEAWPKEMCMRAAQFPGWVQDNPQYRVTDAEVSEDGQTVCFSYEPRPAAA